MFTAATDITTIFSTWHITRAAGLTTYLLLFVIITYGLLMSLQMISPAYRPLATKLHKSAVYWGIFFALVHGGILLVDKHLTFSLADILLPFWSNHHTWKMGMGILAFYSIVLIAIVSNSVIIKAVGRKMWKSIHYLAFPCYLLALFHGYQLGTDSKNWFIISLYATTASIVITLLLRKTWKSL